MKMNYSDFQNEIDKMDMHKLWETCEDLEAQLSKATVKAKELVVKARDTQGATNQSYAQANLTGKIREDHSDLKRASEKANREMRSFYRKAIEPLQEKIVRAKVLFKQKYGKQWVDEENRCVECGRELPAPISEDRGEGHSELITYCKCGETYTGGIC